MADIERMRTREEKVVQVAAPAAAAPPALPDKPSIAVLPFDNLSGDPEQEYFSDGIVEDIITALSRIRWLFVIARNTTFTYKGRAVDVKVVARELGVAYVLEGSVRKAGNRVRITVQLIDGATGNHVWAERYDRDLADIFEVQDEITHTVVGNIEPEVSRAEQERARAKPTESLGAWDLYQQALWHLWRRGGVDDNSEAQRLLQRAIEVDPNFSSAYACLCYAQFQRVALGVQDDAATVAEQCLAFARRAASLDERNPLVHWAMGLGFILRGAAEPAIAALRRATELNPSFAHAHHHLAHAHLMANRPEQAFAEIDLAIRLSPNDPLLFVMLFLRAVAYFRVDDLTTAEAWARRASETPRHNAGTILLLVAILVERGESAAAEQLAEMFRITFPTFDLAGYLSYPAVWQLFGNEDANRLRKAIAKAGLISHG